MSPWSTGRSPQRARPLARSVRAVLGVGAVLVGYYLLPYSAEPNLGVRVLLALAALGLLGAVIIHQVRRDDDPVGRLFVVLVLAVATLALAFHAAAATPGQFIGLETRTDALYFTIITLATIGYGDIYPVGQGARVLVIVAVAFQVVFVTALVSTIARRLRAAAAPPETEQQE